uniref:CWH43-like N-terminal domain-containing protein n=1 Tax=Meloidogyne incognita TaxID=6306 RepID=A0A914KHI6_MELIC
MLKTHMFLIFSEIVGLVLVSVVDIEEYFVFHAIGYALWLISFNFNVLCNTILFYHSVEFYFSPQMCFGLFNYLSIICIYRLYLFWIPLYLQYYSLFSLAEYALVGLNSLWYFLLLWEMDNCEIEIYYN